MGQLDDTAKWLKEAQTAEKLIFAGALVVLLALIGFTVLEFL